MRLAETLENMARRGGLPKVQENKSVMAATAVEPIVCFQAVVFFLSAYKARVHLILFSILQLPHLMRDRMVIIA